MSFRDLMRMALGSLHRQKLRSSLTISGVVIAIGAFVAMLSFGAGNQRMIADQFDDLGLFTTMLVFPSATGDSLQLDEAAVDRLSEINGVRLAYPYDHFDVEVSWGDTTVSVGAQALPTAALQTKYYTNLKAGRLSDEGSGTILVTEELLDHLQVEDADSFIGQNIVVAVKSASFDSAVARLFSDPDGNLQDRFASMEMDSLWEDGYLEGILRQELNAGTKRFLDGYLNAQALTEESFEICGVIQGGGSRRNRILPVILPIETARRFDAAGPSADPMELVPRIMQGEIFSRSPLSGKSYSQVTLDLHQYASHRAVSDSVESMGFEAFSFASQFEEIRRVMLFFNMGLGLVGLVALVTAALGIANTMVMSILERRREIGILRSLGAQPRDIRSLFLVESGAIGALGSLGGILLGWLVARAASMVAKIIMRNQDVQEMELFATPLWLIGFAMAVGILVAVLAGSYPARRAARVDPVEALRQE
ncbi:ABC transporter permease [bacterium]|nr:ABC transporter permease [bacterium]